MTQSQINALVNTALALGGFGLLVLSAGFISSAGWAVADPGHWKPKAVKVAVFLPVGAVLALGGAAMVFAAIW